MRAPSYLCLSLFSYLIVLGVAKVPWGTVASHTLIPHVAHRVEDLEEEDEGGDEAVPLRARSRRDANEKERRSRFDVFTGMGLSNVVMFAIIVATASTLGSHGVNRINSAADAAKALRPIAGSVSTVLFGLARWLGRLMPHVFPAVLWGRNSISLDRLREQLMATGPPDHGS